jgi:hypothetical protein
MQLATKSKKICHRASRCVNTLTGACLTSCKCCLSWQCAPAKLAPMHQPKATLISGHYHSVAAVTSASMAEKPTTTSQPLVIIQLHLPAACKSRNRAYARCLLLGAVEVSLRPSVHLNDLSVVDEQWHINHSARLKCGLLAATTCRSSSTAHTASDVAGQWTAGLFICPIT